MKSRPVPVLMYHHVNPHRGDVVTVTPEVFEKQMRYLRTSGYQILTVNELLSYIAGDLAPSQKAAVITFDDGWLDNYLYAFPVLKRFGIKACIFLVSDWVGNSGGALLNSATLLPDHEGSKSLIKNGRAAEVVLGWEHIKEMMDSGLIEFYAHTRTHPSCDNLSAHELVDELAESKRIIERRLGLPCPYLCWPYGNHNDIALKIAKISGYKAVFTTIPGVVTPGSDPFAIKRIVVKDRVSWFKKRMLIYTNPFLASCYIKMKRK